MQHKKIINDARRGARQVIDEGVHGTRHVIGEQAQDARQRDFKSEAKMQDLLWT